MTDVVNITVVETPVSVTASAVETPIAVSVVVTDVATAVAVDIVEDVTSISIAVTDAPVAVAVNAVQGIGDAPIDGTIYGRQDGAWVEVSTVETDPVFLASEAAGFVAGDAAKLAGIAAGAEVNVNADWNAISGDAQILNKPTIPTGDIKSDGSVSFTGDIRGKDFIGLRSSVITRTGNYISSIAKTGGRTITINRDGNNYITSIGDGTNTWTLTRNGSNQITAITVT